MNMTIASRNGKHRKNVVKKATKASRASKQSFKDINEYIDDCNGCNVRPYTTEDILKTIYDRSIPKDNQKAMRSSLIFDDHVDLNRLVKDHSWYKPNEKTVVTAVKTPKATKSPKAPRTIKVERSIPASRKNIVNTMTVKELKVIARERGIKGYYKLRKADLIQMLNDTPIPTPRPIKVERPVPAPRPIKVERPVPTPRPIKVERPVPAPRPIKTERPIPTPRSKQIVLKPEVEDYKIYKVYEAFNQKFRAWFDEYKVELGEIADDTDPIKVFMRVLNKVKLERKLMDGDKIRLIISHDVWAKPYSTGLLNVNEGLEVMMANKIGNFVEYKSTPLNEVKIEVQSFKLP